MELTDEQIMEATGAPMVLSGHRRLVEKAVTEYQSYLASLTPEKVREEVARMLAFQTLQDEKKDTKDRVWQWVIDNDFVEEYMEKADQILSIVNAEHKRLGNVARAAGKAVEYKEGLNAQFQLKENEQLAETIDFASKVARVMDNLRSSHIFFILQQAYGDIDWAEVQNILDKVIEQTGGLATPIR